MIMPLGRGKKYIHSGGMLSKAFLISSNLGQKVLIIFDSRDEESRFLHTWKHFIGLQTFRIENESGLLGFMTSTEGIFTSTRDLFDLPYISRPEISKYSKDWSTGEKVRPEDAVESLIGYGYTHSRHLSARSFYREGDQITFRHAHAGVTVKLSFFGDEIDDILVTERQGAGFRKIGQIRISDAGFSISKRQLSVRERLEEYEAIFGLSLNFIVGCDFLPDQEKISSVLQAVVFSDIETGEGIDLGFKDTGIRTLHDLEQTLKDPGAEIRIYTRNKKTLSNFVAHNSITGNIAIEDVPGSIRGLESYTYEESGKVHHVICDDVLSDIFVSKRTRKSISKHLDMLIDLKIGDYVVHVDHGIGIFRSIMMREFSGVKREYVEIEYAKGDTLSVPISELHRISKYIGEEKPVLSKFNSGEWQKVLRSTEAEVEKIARELLEIYAKRSIAHSIPLVPQEEQERRFREAFAYDHTIDQNRSIDEVLGDLEKGIPMDRLLVGDVGFGKTEVAMNAIYRCFLNRRQAVFISPLVILANEHYESLLKRFEGFGVRVGLLTRFTSPSEEKTIMRKLGNGELDCAVGTHRLLGEDIRFKNLGLVVIDEEHKFGVTDKEKMNRLRANLDILSLSATPIPRSLNFALNGIRDFSVISTPPPKKQSIDTFVSAWDENVIRNAILSEIGKGGQVIFIHNRIATIESVRISLEKMLGRIVRITIVHGKMSGYDIEKKIMDFRNGKYNILLSTTVVENGVNFMNANTMLIDEADIFGLAQLHQLRGRVGRGGEKGHCFLLYRKELLPDDAKKRLIAIVNHSHLGAGFEIALKDLEIRGAGDILGIKQSGRSKDVGISLYVKLLEEKVEELRSGKKPSKLDCQIDMSLSYSIRDDFFNSESDKLRFFRTMDSIESIDDLDYSYQTFIRSNDEIPEEFENLFMILKARICLSQLHVSALKKVGYSYIFEMEKDVGIPEIRHLFERLQDSLTLIPVTPHKIKSDARDWSDDKQFLTALLRSLSPS